MNERNLLHSSIAVTEIHDACLSLFDQIRDDMKVEYGIVLENTLWPAESLGNRLISKANHHFNTVADKEQNTTTDAAQNLMNSGIHKQLCKDIPVARDRVLTDLSLFIDGHSKIQRSKRIKSWIVYLPKLIGKFFKS